MTQTRANKPLTAARGGRRTRRPSLYEPLPLRRYLCLAVVSMCAVFAVWAALSYGNAVQRLFLPTPGDVWHAAVAEAKDGTLGQDAGASVTRILVGFAVSTVLAVPVGLLMGVYKKAEALLEPPVDFVRYMPAVAFIPLTLIWFGTTTTQKIVILFIGIFFQEVLLIADNVKTVPRPYVEMAYTLGLSSFQVIRQVVLRSALPGMIDTLRISLGWAWTYLVVAELVGADDGLGFRIQQAQRYLDTASIILNIIVIGILGLVFDFGFKALHSKAFPYLARR